jgi:predicted permease
MNWRDYVRTALGHHTPHPDDDVVEELAQHAGDAFAAARAEGVSVQDAEARVCADIERWCSERTVQSRRPKRPPVIVPPDAASTGLTGLWQDARYALRLLGRQPGFAALAVLTTALGVGATTTLGSVAYGVLARPFPYPDADRLVRVVETRADTTRQLPPIMSNAPYHAWKDGAQTIDGIAAFSVRAMTLDMDGAEPSRVRGIAATASLFSVLGSRPLHGTYFTDANEVEGNRNVMVLSYGLWMERFGGTADVVGTRVRLDGDSYTVIGVAPRDFMFPDRNHRFWLPYVVPPPDPNSVSLFASVARMKAGVTAEQAAAEATALARSGTQLALVGTAVFGTQSPPVVEATPLIDFLAGDVRPALFLLLGAVLLLFLTAIANVASMQLARATARRRELALRGALGAGHGRLARQLVVEGIVLGFFGGIAGVILAAGLHAALPALLPADFPRLMDIRLDWTLVSVALVIAIAAGTAFGLLPALQARRLDLVTVLNEDGQAPVGIGLRSSTGFVRTAILVSQVAAATVLLVGAVLLVRSFAERWNIDRGYEPANVLTAELAMPNYAFTGETRANTMSAILERLNAQPGVTAAGFTTILPMASFEALAAFQLPPQDQSGTPRDVQAAVRTVSPEYQRAMGIRLSAGRWLRDDDTSSSPPVVVVNRAFVQAYLSGDGLGTRLPVGLSEDVDEWEIVGVVDDIHPHVDGEPPRPEIFVAMRQRSGGLEFASPSVVVRTAGDPASLAPMVRQIATDAHPAIAVEAVLTMEDRLRAGLAEPRLYSVLVGGFALLALVIASAGLFGVVSYTVARRTRELGIRAAIGATPGRLLWLVLGQGLVVTGLGVAIGLGVAALGASVMSVLVYGVGTHDRLTFTLVPVVLIVIAAVACVVPARRASRTDPLRALRQS